jgi:hypothetical protein
VIFIVIAVKTLHLLYQNFSTNTVKQKQENPAVKAVNPQPEFKPGILQMQYFGAECEKQGLSTPLNI